ncbi:MAG: hypothetical protein VCB80_07865 [Deltaproteobacteria bacterium]
MAVPAFHFDEELEASTLFFSVPKKNAVWVRAILDSYETLGVVRSEDPELEGDRSLMVFISVPDMVGDSVPVFEELARLADVEFVHADARLLAQLRSELAA